MDGYSDKEITDIISTYRNLLQPLSREQQIDILSWLPTDIPSIDATVTFYMRTIIDGKTLTPLLRDQLIKDLLHVHYRYYKCGAFEKTSEFEFVWRYENTYPEMVWLPNMDDELIDHVWLGRFYQYSECKVLVKDNMPSGNTSSAIPSDARRPATASADKRKGRGAKSRQAERYRARKNAEFGAELDRSLEALKSELDVSARGRYTQRINHASISECVDFQSEESKVCDLPSECMCTYQFIGLIPVVQEYTLSEFMDVVNENSDHGRVCKYNLEVSVVSAISEEVSQWKVVPRTCIYRGKDFMLTAKDKGPSTMRKTSGNSNCLGFRRLVDDNGLRLSRASGIGEDDPGGSKPPDIAFE